MSNNSARSCQVHLRLPSSMKMIRQIKSVQWRFFTGPPEISFPEPWPHGCTWHAGNTSERYKLNNSQHTAWKHIKMGYNDKFAIEIIGKYIYVYIYCIMIAATTGFGLLWFQWSCQGQHHAVYLIYLPEWLSSVCCWIKTEGCVCVPGVKRCALSVWCHVESLLDC